MRRPPSSAHGSRAATPRPRRQELSRPTSSFRPDQTSDWIRPAPDPRRDPAVRRVDGQRPAQGLSPIPGVRNEPDVVPPTSPTHLADPGATKTSVSLNWTTATDNLGVAGYPVYVGGKKVATTTSTRYTVPKLECGMSYTLAIDASDAARNHSARASATVWTSRCWIPP